MKFRLNKKRKTDKLTPEEIVHQCQTHPEFNRLAFVLRQALQSRNLPAAQQAFLRMDALKIGLGIGESTLMQLAAQLGQQKQWVDAIRPLAIASEKRGVMADDACLRLAQIQMKVLKRNDLAIATLSKIKVPEGTTIDDSKLERLQKRDELLKLARGGDGAGV